MHTRKIQALFATLALLKVLSVSASDYPLQYQVEKCLGQKISDEYPNKEGQIVAIRFLPAQIGNNVTATVLAETLLTNIYTSDHFVLGVGGGINPTDFSKGLITVFDRFEDPEFTERLKKVTIVYYSHYAILSPLHELTERYDIRLVSKSMDSRNEASLIGSGC